MKKIMVILSLLFTTICFADSDPLSLSSYLKYFGEIDKEMFSVNTLKMDDEIYIYYSAKGLKLVKTSDFKTFDDLNLDISSLDDGKGIITNNWVFKSGDKYKMVYEKDIDDTRELYIAESSDGLKFINPKLIIAGDSEDINSNSGKVFLSVPDGIILDNNTIRMYFVSDGSDIRSAYSNDNGNTWIKDSGIRISNGVDPCIMKFSSGKYRMVYTGWDNINHSLQAKSILYADSDDGLKFGKGKTILSINTSNKYSGYSIVDPEIVKLSDNNYKLLVTYSENDVKKLLIYDIDESWLNDENNDNDNVGSILSCATFDMNEMKLHIPYVNINSDSNYWLDFKLTDVEKITFELYDFNTNQNVPEDAENATFNFESNILYIPCFNYDNINYYLKLKLINSNPVTFSYIESGYK